MPGDIVFCNKNRKLGIIPVGAKTWNFFKTSQKNRRLLHPNTAWTVEWADGTRSHSDTYWLHTICPSPLWATGKVKSMEPADFRKTLQWVLDGVPIVVAKTQENMDFLIRAGVIARPKEAS